MLSRADLVQRLRSLAQEVATDDKLSLDSVADSLEVLLNQLKRQLPDTTVFQEVMTTKSISGIDEPQLARHLASRLGHGTLSDAAVTAAAVTAVPESKSEDNALADNEVSAQPLKKQRRAPREFDFSRYRTRYVALELMYVGWAFQGFARQENTENTIEGALFSALRKVKLIPEASVTPISELQYSRCGRTDRGVSALGQVVALRLRSSARVDEPEAPLEQEFDYPRLINKALPIEIRILGWAAVPEDFNARFSAQYREYKYFIVQQRLEAAPPATDVATSTASAGVAAAPDPIDASAASATAASDGPRPAPAAAAPSVSASAAPDCTSPSYALDIAAMREAAARFIGEHDFRNFCKADVAAVRSFRRRILSFTIDPVSTSAGGRGQKPGEPTPGQGYGAHQVYALTVRGTAFLWHQVRCMAAVLLMVGRRQERPEVVSALLDIEATPRKPQYSMAPEEPLLLYACGFSDLAFRRSPAAVEGTLADVAGLLHRHLIGAALTEACHARLAADERCADPMPEGKGGKADSAGRSGIPGSVSTHIPLLRRQKEPSIEERMARRGILWPPEPVADGGGVGTGGDEGDPMVE